MSDPAHGDMAESLEIGNKVATGFVWLIIQSVLGRAVSVFSQIVLAWLLLPADFGKITLAFTVTTLPMLLASSGPLEFLIQRHRAIKRWSTTVFWISVWLGILAGTLMCILAMAASPIYGTDLIGLVSIIALAAPISAASTVSLAIIRSSLRFDVLAVIGIMEILLTSIITVSLALLKLGAYSFAIPIPIIAAFRLMILWHFAPVSIGASANVRRWRVVTRRASAMIGTRLVQSFVGQADYTILGALASETVVGYYSVALRFAVQPIHILAGNVHSIVFPALSRFTDEPTRQYEATLAASRLLATVIFPICFVQAAVADPLVRLIFGEKWVPAVLLIQILSVGFAFDAVGWAFAALIQAQGEFRRDLLYNAAIALPFFGLVFVGASYAGATGVATAVSGYYTLCHPLYAWLVFRRGNLPTRRLAVVYIRPSAMAAIAVGAALWLSHSLEPALGDGIAKIILIAAASGLGYIAILYFLDRGSYNELWFRAAHVLARVLARPPV
jgi:PST family polysaccharide transporter